ncbi:MAG TPA: AAA family ATPase [Rhodanobacteraceae bacterium]|nr:AAA family ATPase [Rhodanobacteraceae bacterium]
MSEHATLITALMQTLAAETSTPPEVLETHISWVLLAGDFAYKVKKPVRLPFADFSTLAARRHYCEEELRLNRRLAPQVYLDVVPITGRPDAPRFGGAGEALDYAVRMRRFAQDAMFDHLLAAGRLRPEHLDRLAERIARFHTEAPVTREPAFGTPERVLQPALDNFTELTAHADAGRRTALDRLAAWTRDAYRTLAPTLAARHRGGFIRECHGDLHLRNIVLLDDQPVPFDCIEFSDELRWIDVMSEVAFLVMDLLDRGQPTLAYRFLDAYLAHTGDYAGVAVLRFYLAYRALVRAKVHALRARQMGDDANESARLQAATDHYIELADEVAHGAKPALIIMHGLSGSGKSRIAAALVKTLHAIRLRSDVERKRLFGLAATADSQSAVGAGLYGADASARSYNRLADLARPILDAGYPIIVDAAFLARAQRDSFRGLAHEAAVPFRIVDCHADPVVLRDRIAARATDTAEPSEATTAVLEHQLV